MQRCIDDQIATAIETCGYAPWKKLEILVPVTGLFLYDLKSMDDERHQKYTGFSNRLILANLVNLRRLTNRIVIRVPIIPNFNDSEKNIEEIARFVNKLRVLKEIDLLPYHRLGLSKYKKIGKTYKLNELLPPTEEKMDRLKDVVSSFGLKCVIEN